MYYVSWLEYKENETIDYLNAFDNEEDRDRFARSLRYKGVRIWEQPMWAQKGENKKSAEISGLLCAMDILFYSSKASSNVFAASTRPPVIASVNGDSSSNSSMTHWPSTLERGMEMVFV